MRRVVCAEDGEGTGTALDPRYLMGNWWNERRAVGRQHGCWGEGIVMGALVAGPTEEDGRRRRVGIVRRLPGAGEAGVVQVEWLRVRPCADCGGCRQLPANAIRVVEMEPGAWGHGDWRSADSERWVALSLIHI